MISLRHSPRWVMFVALMAGMTLSCGQRQRPNIVLIVIDTLRADHLGSYGYARPTSPHIDQLAARGTIFDDANAVASYTRPSSASILTGLYPSVHGAVTHADSISQDVPTLAEALAAVGYSTHGIYRNGNVSETFGFGRGFESYVSPDKNFWRGLKKAGVAKSERRFVSQTDDSLLTREAVPLIKEVEDKPFFLYLHLGGPHDPYSPPREAVAPFLDAPLTPIAEMFYTQPVKRQREQPAVLQQMRQGLVELDELTRQQVVALYDGEIVFSDQQIGAVVKALEETGRLDDTVILLTSDHGEELWDHHDLGHGQSHYRELLRVPLIVAGPGVQNRRIATPVSLIDLAPTILELAGITPSAGLAGESLAQVLRSRRVMPARAPVYAEGLLRLLGNGDPMLFRSVQAGHQKLILDFQRHRKMLFDVQLDAGEHNSLMTANPRQSRLLLDTLVNVHRSNLDSAYLAPVEVVEIPAEVEEQIRALGYLGQASDSASASLFRAPLRVMDVESHGFMGNETEGKLYGSEIDFSTLPPSSEQLLYGWGKLIPGRLSRGMARIAGARLERQETHTRWLFRGQVRVAERQVVLAVRIDGGEPTRWPLAVGEQFEISGRLPLGRSFSRFDFECEIAGLEAAGENNVLFRLCLTADYLGLDAATD